MHARWIVFLEKFNYVFVHNSGSLNKVANALSRQALLLSTLHNELVGFEAFKDQYVEDEDFSKIWDACNKHAPSRDFVIREGFLFREQQLCVPKSSLREHLIREMHAGGLFAHAGHDKAITLLEARFFWLQLK